MSAIQIPGLDIDERSPGAFRVRVRVHPFFALTATLDNELAAVAWGCRQLERLHALHKTLSAEARLPTLSLSREAAQTLGLAEAIAGESDGGDQDQAPPGSPGDGLLVFEVLE